MPQITSNTVALRLSAPGHAGGDSAVGGKGLDLLPPPVAEVFETQDPVRISERDRCGGVYILGRPRTGKSTLLVSLALSDIERGHGILFIDPHTDTINELVSRIPASRLQDVIVLDPTDKKRSFSINLLDCADPTDPLALDRTYGRVKDIFIKIWGGESGQLGVWLEKILRNSVYLLLENEGHTLVDIPLLLEEDTRFRNFLLGSIKAKPYISDFWLKEFDRLTSRERTEQVGPALNRLSVFRDNTTVRHIVGQARSSINFHEIINGAGRPKIVLLRLPTYFYDEEKQIIASILLGEVLSAITKRANVPETNRRWFGVYCDEFQNFATADFAKLFTETGKFNVMPVVAHHERVGQFAGRDPNRGATGAAPNKIFFSLSEADANEAAPGFAREPPDEVRLEERYVICQEPVDHLLRRGHDNPDICEFVNRIIRPMRDAVADARDEMEGERLVRMNLLDEAALARIDERVDWLGTRGREAQEILGRAGAAIESARSRTGRMQDILTTTRSIRRILRAVDRALTAVMEGASRAGTEDFGDFLIGFVRELGRVPDGINKLLELYLSVYYGDHNKARGIPFDFSERHDLFSSHTGLSVTYVPKVPFWKTF